MRAMQLMATAGARGWVRVWSRECQQTASMEAVYCNCYVLLVLLAVGMQSSQYTTSK
jgi:hypothetical protein